MFRLGELIVFILSVMESASEELVSPEGILVNSFMDTNARIGPLYCLSRGAVDSKVTNFCLALFLVLLGKLRCVVALLLGEKFVI